MNSIARRFTVSTTAVLTLGLIGSPSDTDAVGDLTNQQPIEIRVQLGNEK